jgi:hypothetical protein
MDIKANAPPSLLSLWAKDRLSAIISGEARNLHGAHRIYTALNPDFSPRGEQRIFFEQLLLDFEQNYFKKYATPPGQEVIPAMLTAFCSISPSEKRCQHQWSLPGSPWIDNPDADWRERSLARLLWLGAKFPDDPSLSGVSNSRDHFCSELVAGGFTGTAELAFRMHPDLLPKGELKLIAQNATIHGDHVLLKLLKEAGAPLDFAYAYASIHNQNQNAGCSV